MYFYIFIELQEANELLEQPINVSSVIYELRNEQHFLETSGVEKFKT